MTKSQKGRKKKSSRSFQVIVTRWGLSIDKPKHLKVLPLIRRNGIYKSLHISKDEGRAAQRKRITVGETDSFWAGKRWNPCCEIYSGFSIGSRPGCTGIPFIITAYGQKSWKTPLWLSSEQQRFEDDLLTQRHSVKHGEAPERKRRKGLINSELVCFSIKFPTVILALPERNIKTIQLTWIKQDRDRSGCTAHDTAALLQFQIFKWSTWCRGWTALTLKTQEVSSWSAVRNCLFSLHRFTPHLGAYFLWQVAFFLWHICVFLHLQPLFDSENVECLSLSVTMKLILI